MENTVTRLQAAVDKAQARVIRRIVAVGTVDAALLAEARATRDRIEERFMEATLDQAQDSIWYSYDEWVRESFAEQDFLAR